LFAFAFASVVGFTTKAKAAAVHYATRALRYGSEEVIRKPGGQSVLTHLHLRHLRCCRRHEH
jgi:hypothetical protein